MKITIIILVIVVILFVLCRVLLRKRVKDVIQNGSLRFFIGLVIVLAILWLNRYSILAVPVVMHNDHSFGESVSMSFAMENDLYFYVNLMTELMEEQETPMPKYLEKSLTELMAGESDDLANTIGDIFELTMLAW